MAKLNTKSTMYVEYSNLIKDLEIYMPQFKASLKDIQEPSQTFVTNFYTDALMEFFGDVNNLTEVFLTFTILFFILKFYIYGCTSLNLYSLICVDPSHSKSYI